MAEPRERIFEVLGLRIRALEWGQPGGLPLILVHGFLDQAQSWRPFVDALYRATQTPLWIIAPDCRGHGDSGWTGAGGYYHFPDYVLDLDHVVQGSKLSKFALVGHSMGGTIAFLYAGTFPKRVTQLVLIEGIGPRGMNFAEAPKRMGQWIGDVHERGRRHFREYTGIAAGADQLRQTNPRLSHDAALDLARTGMKQDDKGKWVWKFDPLHRTAAPQPFYTVQSLEFLRRIECPVLIVEGGQSRQSRRTDRQERYDALIDHRRVVIEDAGHMVHQDQPARLAATVGNFLGLQVNQERP